MFWLVISPSESLTRSHSSLLHSAQSVTLTFNLRRSAAGFLQMKHPHLDVWSEAHHYSCYLLLSADLTYVWIFLQLVSLNCTKLSYSVKKGNLKRCMLGCVSCSWFWDVKRSCCVGLGSDWCSVCDFHSTFLLFNSIISVFLSSQLPILILRPLAEAASSPVTLFTSLSSSVVLWPSQWRGYLSWIYSRIKLTAVLLEIPSL